MTIIEKILLELCAKDVVEDGMPDFTNEKHLLALNEVLVELNWPMEARGELLYTLMEKDGEEPKLDDEEKEKAKKMGLVWKGKGYGKEGQDGITHKNDGGKLVKVSKDGDEKETGGPNIFSNPDDAERKPTTGATKGKEPKGSETDKKELTPQEREELTKKDIELVETQLFLYEDDPQEKGGAGTPTSRTGECVTTYAGRRIKKMMEEGMDYDEAREKVRQELLEHAKSKKDGKKPLLTKEWIESGLRCLDWIHQNIGLDKIEDFAWDTPEGNELVGSTGHGTSADMFVKTTEGRTIGISLKKDFKVFVFNGGMDKNVNLLADEMGIDRNDLPDELQYKGNPNSFHARRENIFKERIDKFNNSEVKEKVCENFEKAKKGGDDYKSVFGAATVGNMKRLKQVAKRSGKEIKDLTCDDLYDNVINREKHTGDDKAVIFGFAQHDSEIEEGVGNLYGETRAMDNVQASILFNFITKEENADKFKDMVSHHTHIDDVLFGTDGDELDKLEVLYGEPPAGEAMKPESLVAMFDIGDLYEKYKNEKDPIRKEELKKEIQAEIKKKMVITKKKGKPVIGVKIKNPSPPPPESVQPLFTLSVRSKGITAAPAMEMGQTVFGGLAFKNGNVEVDTWPPEDRAKYINAEGSKVEDELDNEEIDFKDREAVLAKIQELENLIKNVGDGIKFTPKSKINKAIARLKQGLEDN